MAQQKRDKSSPITLRCVALTADGPTVAAGQIALVPGEMIPTLPLELPAGLRGSTREQVARRQLFDGAALNPQTTEIRPLTLSDHGEDWTHALVADRTLIAQWVELAGPACRAVLPDYLALPTAQHVWVLQADDSRVLVRTGLSDGFAAEYNLATFLLKQSLSDAEMRPKVVLWLGTHRPPELAALLDAEKVLQVDTPAAVVAAGLSHPQAFAGGELDLDLRRDPFATRARLRRRIMPWRWPAVLAMIATGLWAAAQIIATEALRQETRVTAAATLATVRQHFVPSGPILDVRTQVSRAVANARAQTTSGQEGLRPLALFGHTVDAITAPGFAPQQALYGAADGLQIMLMVPNFAAGEALVGQLKASGLHVDVLRSEVGVERDGVQLELRIQATEARP